MRVSMQAVALIGVFVSCGAMLPAGEALAFGQQWRPAPGFLPVQGQAYGAGINTAAFRPRAPLRPSRAQPYEPLQRRSYVPGMYQRPVPPQNGYIPGYRMPAFGPAQRAGYYPPQPQFVPQGYPENSMAARQTWGQQGPAPMFARQYAWRPAQRPLIVQRGGSEPRPQPAFETRMPERRMGFRPAGPGYPAPGGGWRPSTTPAPVGQPRYAYGQYGRQAPGYADYRQNPFRSGRPPVWPSPGVRMAGANPAPVAQPNWRPAPSATGGWLPGDAFRPAAYGRSLAQDDRSAEGNGSRIDRGTLPGWVTTHQETGEVGSCGWCSGS